MIGVAALTVALLCNLQYSFFSAKNNPSAAKAEFTYDGTLYCGTDNGTHTGFRVGTWVQITDTGSSYYGWYYFVPSDSGTQCGLPDEEGAPRYDGYVVTSTPPTMQP